MPRDPHPSDWNRLFDPSYRRRGPVGLFFFASFLSCLLAVLFVGASFGKREIDRGNAALYATSTPAWATARAGATATAAARTAIAMRPTAPAMPLAQIANAGNFRSAPEITPKTVLGQLGAGDQVTLVENRTVGGHVWYRVRLVKTIGSLRSGAEGWISSTLLPAPAAGSAGSSAVSSPGVSPAP